MATTTDYVLDVLRDSHLIRTTATTTATKRSRWTALESLAMKTRRNSPRLVRLGEMRRATLDCPGDAATTSVSFFENTEDLQFRGPSFSLPL